MPHANHRPYHILKHGARLPAFILIVMLMLLFTLMLPMTGCGTDDSNTPKPTRVKQTQAMVPGTVGHQDHDLPEVSGGDLGNANQQEPVQASAPAQLPEAQLPEAQLPDTQLPDTPLSDAQLPDTQLPSTQRPGAQPAGSQQHHPNPSFNRIIAPYSLQLGSFTTAAAAQEKSSQLQSLGHTPTIEQAEVNGQLYHRLFIRGLKDRQTAENLGQELRRDLGLNYLVKEWR